MSSLAAWSWKPHRDDTQGNGTKTDTHNSTDTLNRKRDKNTTLRIRILPTTYHQLNSVFSFVFSEIVDLLKTKGVHVQHESHRARTHSRSNCVTQHTTTVTHSHLLNTHSLAPPYTPSHPSAAPIGSTTSQRKSSCRSVSVSAPTWCHWNECECMCVRRVLVWK